MSCTAPSSCDNSKCSSILGLSDKNTSNYIYSFQQVVDDYKPSEISYVGCGEPPSATDSICPNKQGSNTDSLVGYSTRFTTNNACLCHSKYSGSGLCKTSDMQCATCTGNNWLTGNWYSNATNYLKYTCMTVDPTKYTNSNLPVPKNFSRFAAKVADNNGTQYNVYQFQMDFNSTSGFIMNEKTLSTFSSLFLTPVPSYFRTNTINGQNVYQCNLNYYNCLLNYFCCLNGEGSNIATTTCQNSNLISTCADTNYCPNMDKYCNTASTFSTTPCVTYYQNSYNSSGILSATATDILNSQCAPYVDNDYNVSDKMPTICGCFLPTDAYKAYWAKIIQYNPALEGTLTDAQCEYPGCVKTGAIQPKLNHECRDLNIVTCLMDITTGNISDSSSLEASNDCFANSSTGSQPDLTGSSSNSGNSSNNSDSTSNNNTSNTSTNNTSTNTLSSVSSFLSTNKTVVIVIIIIAILIFVVFRILSRRKNKKTSDPMVKTLNTPNTPNTMPPSSPYPWGPYFGY